MSNVHEQFMREFIDVEPKLRAYALSCGLSIDQVDDLVQEAALVLWRRYADYDASMPFISWALGVTHHLIQETWRSRVKSQRLLSPEISQRLAITCTDVSEEMDSKRELLRLCVEKLSDWQRALLHTRYAKRLSLAAIAKQLNKGLSTVSMRLHRIRLALLRCVEEEGRA